MGGGDRRGEPTVRHSLDVDGTAYLEEYGNKLLFREIGKAVGRIGEGHHVLPKDGQRCVRPLDRNAVGVLDEGPDHTHRAQSDRQPRNQPIGNCARGRAPGEERLDPPHHSFRLMARGENE